jgi:S1-C subfamily serine protease
LSAFAQMIFNVLTILAICFGSMAAEAAQRRAPTTVDRIRDMKAAVVQVGFVSDPPQANPAPIAQRAGTGFFVSKRGYVLTAGHVIQLTEAGAKAHGASNVLFKVGLLLDSPSIPGVKFQGNFEWVDASVIGIDDLHDLALLKLSRNPFTGEIRSGINVQGKDAPLTVGVARLDATLPPEGDDVLISGYPLEIPTLVTQTGMVASESYSLKKTQQPGAPAGFVTTQVQDSILLDAVVNPGNSGGPVYGSKSGDVVGICDAYELSPLVTNKSNPVQTGPEEFLTQNAGLAIVIQIKYGMELLKKNGVWDFLATQTHSPEKVH